MIFETVKIGIINGESMFPTLQNGDKAVILKCSADLCRRGDIITYNGDDGYVIHRLVGKIILPHTMYLIDKGDNSKSYNLILEKYIVGKAIAIIRNNILLSIDKKKYGFLDISTITILIFYIKFLCKYIGKFLKAKTGGEYG